MHFFASAAAVAATFLALGSTVSAHGYLKYIDTAGVRYPAWQVGQDDYLTPVPSLTRFSRRIKDNGPVPDFRTTNITCNVGGNTPTEAFIQVSPGQQVKFVWDQWGSSHSGPVMTYLAKCSPNCANFKGDSGPVWTKIDQMGWDPAQSPPWASDKLATLGASWTVVVPPGIAAGEYILRHEILGLHVAGTAMGAQFYPSCVQIKVTGSGSVVPPGGVSLPGAYVPEDQGILVELWKYGNLLFNYTAPGGPVWSGAGAQLNGAGSVPSPTTTATWAGSVPTSTPPASSSTTSVRTTTTATTTTTTPAPVTTTTKTTTTTQAATTTAAAGTVTAWGQCGGINYTGATGCVSGYNCKVINDYYHQCVPN